MFLIVTENLKLFKLDAKCLQVRIHNVLSLSDMCDTQFVQIQIRLQIGSLEVVKPIHLATRAWRTSICTFNV